MQVNQTRTLALSAAAVALLFVASAGARQQGDAKVPAPAQAQNAPATAADRAAPAVVAPAPAPAHQHRGAPVGKIPAESQNAKGKLTTIVGEVMDPACFLEAGAKSIGPGHYQCAIDCAKSGQTLAIYDRDEDRIYMIAGELPGKNPNDPVIAFIHKKVDVTGTVYHRSGAYGIVILKVALHEGKPAGAEKADADGKAGASKVEAANGRSASPTTGAPAGK